MKRGILIVASLVLLSFASCKKEDSLVRPAPEGKLLPVEFSVNDEFAVEVMGTKAVTEVTTATLSTIYVSATTGTAGSETSKWNSIAFTKNGSNFTSAGRYWPATDPQYHFYASNVALTANAAGCTVAPNGTADVVCAYLASPTYLETNALTFSHIYSRIATLSLAAADATNFTVSNISWKLLAAKTSGTYNIRTGAWTATGADKTLTASPDVLIVPGTYSLQCTYTIADKNGNYSKTFTKTASITLAAGKKYTISAKATHDATDIVFTVTVTPWATATLTPTF